MQLHSAFVGVRCAAKSVVVSCSGLQGDLCRNPLGMMPQPWCFVSSWPYVEMCDVQPCDMHSAAIGSGTADAQAGSSDSRSKVIIAVLISLTVLAVSALIIACAMLRRRRNRRDGRGHGALAKGLLGSHRGEAAGSEQPSSGASGAASAGAPLRAPILPLSTGSSRRTTPHTPQGSGLPSASAAESSATKSTAGSTGGASNVSRKPLLALMRAPWSGRGKVEPPQMWRSNPVAALPTRQRRASDDSGAGARAAPRSLAIAAPRDSSNVVVELVDYAPVTNAPTPSSGNAVALLKQELGPPSAQQAAQPPPHRGDISDSTSELRAPAAGSPAHQSPPARLGRTRSEGMHAEHMLRRLSESAHTVWDAPASSLSDGSAALRRDELSIASAGGVRSSTTCVTTGGGHDLRVTECSTTMHGSVQDDSERSNGWPGPGPPHPGPRGRHPVNGNLCRRSSTDMEAGSSQGVWDGGNSGQQAEQTFGLGLWRRHKLAAACSFAQPGARHEAVSDAHAQHSSMLHTPTHSTWSGVPLPCVLAVIRLTIPCFCGRCLCQNLALLCMLRLRQHMSAVDAEWQMLSTFRSVCRWCRHRHNVVPA